MASLSQVASPSERAAIEAVVQTYLDGLYEGDAAKIERAFHKTSALAQSHDGQIQITPRDVWLDAVRSRPSPKSKGLARHDEILSIDVAGPTMAFVKLKCAIPPRFFTDQLNFLKIDGQWVIAQKIFQTEVRE